jgi:endonuclease-3
VKVQFERFSELNSGNWCCMNEEIKLPFDIDVVMDRIREAVKSFPKAAMFKLADDGFNSLFEQLVACIISIRTLDEVTIPTARRLFSVARTAEETSRLSVEQIDNLISTCTFHEAKAPTIKKIAERTMSEFSGNLPCDYDVITSFRGVGVKCANLALGIACGESKISVDVHVHRVINRWGIISTNSPEKSLVELEKILPKHYWVEINSLLVPFGKHICTGKLPKCSICPVLAWCRQVGVKAHR